MQSHSPYPYKDVKKESPLINAESLGSHNEFLLSIIDGVGDGVAVVNMEGELILFNKAAKTILGLGLTSTKPDQWSHTYGLFLPDQESLCPMEELPLLRALQGEEVAEQELLVRNEVNEGCYISVKARPIFDEDGVQTGAVAIFRDITAVRAMTQKLHESKQRFESIFRAIPSAVALLDNHNNIVTTNPSFTKTFGYEPEMIEGEKIARIFEEMPPVLDAANREDEVSSFEVTCWRRSKESFQAEGVLAPVYLDQDQETSCSLLILRDISHRIEAEQHLRFTYHVLDSCSLAAIWSDKEGAIRYVNEAAANFLGYSKKELLEKSVLDFDCRAFHDPDYYTHIWEAVKRNGNLILETETQTREGKILPVEVHVKHIPYLDTEYACAFFHDVSQRKEAESALLQDNQVKNEFVAILSQELRAPMTSIIGYTNSLLEESDKLSEIQERDLSRILDTSHQLLALISDILDISRIEAGSLVLHPELFDLSNLVVRCQEEIASLAKQKGLALHIEGEIAPFPFEGDQARIHQIVMTLLSRAVKCTDRGGITLRFVADEQGGATISVEDTGSTLSRDQIATIFQPFTQIGSGSPKLRERNGLGLTMAQRLAKLHGGYLEVESTQNQGSCFTLHLQPRSAH